MGNILIPKFRKKNKTYSEKWKEFHKELDGEESYVNRHIIYEHEERRRRIIETKIELEKFK